MNTEISFEHRRKQAVVHALRVLGIEELADRQGIDWDALAETMYRPVLAEYLRTIYDGTGFAVLSDLFDTLDEVERGAILLALRMIFETE